MDQAGERRLSHGMLSILASLALVSGVFVASAGPAAAATCPTVASGTGVVTPPPAPGVNWSGCHLDGADLSFSDLSSANLAGATLDNANLSHANLSNANLFLAQVSDANATSANLSYANLSHAYVGYSDLIGANLSHAVLRYVYLQYSDLSNADLSHADLHGANVYFTNLTDAVLGYARADDVKWVFATCPDGQSSEERVGGKCSPSLSITVPNFAPAGSRVKITGRLRDEDAACSAGQPVTLKSEYSTLGTTTTNAIGAYRFVLKVRRTARIGVVYKGAPTCAGDSSVRERIWVT